MKSLCQSSQPTPSGQGCRIGVLQPLVCWPTSKPDFKKTVINPFKKTALKKTDIKKGAKGPLPDRCREMNLVTEPHPKPLEWQGWLVR